MSICPAEVYISEQYTIVLDWGKSGIVKMYVMSEKASKFSKPLPSFLYLRPIFLSLLVEKINHQQYALYPPIYESANLTLLLRN